MSRDNSHDPASPAPDPDAERWREVALLRREHEQWVIIWLAPAGEFRAYRRLPRARRDTAVAAATADGLSAAIGQAELAAEQTALSRKVPG